MAAPGLRLFGAPAGAPAAEGLWKGSLTSLRETIDRDAVRDNTLASGGTGVMLTRFLPLYAGDQITNLVCRIGGTAGSGTTHFWMALYDTSGNLVDQTADQGSASLVANTAKDFALSLGTYRVTRSGIYGFSVCQAFSVTGATFYGQAVSSGTIAGGLVAGQLPKTVTSGSGLTTTAPGSIASPTPSSSSIYIAGYTT